MQILHSLCNLDNQETFHQAWSTFFLNPELVRQVAVGVEKDKATEVLRAGANWNGSGWNTGRASKQLHDLVGVPLVTSEFLEYQNAFFYALALLWEVEVPQLELSDRAAQAAFALATYFQSGEAPHQFGLPPVVSATGKDQPHEEEQEDIVMEWDEPLLSLPQELAVLWAEVQQGTRELNLVTVLDQIPKFVDLPLNLQSTTSEQWVSPNGTGSLEVTNKPCCTA